MFYEVIPTRLFRQDGGVLTYSSDEKLAPGTIVEIPLGKSTTVGIIARKVAPVDFPTKPILKKLYDVSLPRHIIKSIFWLADYYQTALPKACNLFLPVGIGKKRRKTAEVAEILPVASAETALPEAEITKNGTASTPESAPNGTKTAPERVKSQPAMSPQIALNAAQRRALEAINTISTPTKLLHGVTGSGKTNIYLKLAESTLKSGKSVILLVPEIALTSQLVQIFQETFRQRITLIHSRQTEAERHLIWEEILTAKAPQIIIGPRSALLSPVQDLGLIIIDEAHESTYFQENAPRYSALRLASFMASSAKISCILGTATPLVADYYLAQSKRSLVTLSEKAKSTAKPPDFHIVNLGDQTKFTKNRYFSDALLSQIEENLQNKRQTLIFHNRRGSAPLTICENCGWQALCPNCFLPLTLHADTYELICHTCGHSTTTPSSCPDCGHPSIIHKGFGTKLLESELGRLFKSARIIRFDADNKKSETLDSKFTEVKNGDYDIIIGTQTIAKGLDLPLLATVGIVQADSGLTLPDYSSEEKTFHLLTQVTGRVGRGHLDVANVYVQTYQPDHPVIVSALDSDYDSFCKYLLNKRKQGRFPPFYYLAKLSVTYKTEAIAVKYIRGYQKILAKNPEIVVSNPTPAFHERTGRGFTWQLTLRARSRQALLTAVSALSPNSHLSVWFDPPTLL